MSHSTTMATTATAPSPKQPADTTMMSSTQGTTGKIVSEYLQCHPVTIPTKRPLTLLDLPVDVLRLIVKEITHTNDLTSLALTNSALHNLAIPLIYSRFDIVWPDGNITTSETKSVDALTYGLSTLCLGSAFARSTRRKFTYSNSRPLGKFMGNEYAKYTKKFSLGNGPKDWVEEYMITKESGKMLGTLVAIAVAKMKNLEAFVWDMPTGVLSDVFMALGSLGEEAEDDCKLSRVWIRWHDNAEHLVATSPGLPAVVPLGSAVTPIGIMLPENASHPTPRPPVSYSEHHCEYPTFSVLPPLKSLTVLDIDELSYLDEMAVLIERSKETLKELRVGIATKASHKDFVQTWDGPGLKQIDHRARWPGESTIGERRLGGVLGVLVGKIYDIRKRASGIRDRVIGEASTGSNTTTSSATPVSTDTQIEAVVTPASTPASSNGPNGDSAQTISNEEIIPIGILAKAQALLKGDKPGKPRSSGRKRLEGKLKLENLELERVPLSMQVCRSAIDWSTLTGLTLLDCAQHETLWKILRKSFQPTPVAGTGSGMSANRNAKTPAPGTPLEYHLALKHIHTDITTPALITFIKETIAPNSLETLFLQDRRRGSGPPLVHLDAIFKGALKRHRTSLQKILLDSSAKPALQPTPVVENTRWRSWVLSTEVLLYITSGRMVNLKELAVSLNYKDWHTFLQRLPNVPQLHSINIPDIADYVAPNAPPRELAHQIMDIVTLRPEIRLCYIGIGNKCFEILETRDTGSRAQKGIGSNFGDDSSDEAVAAAAAAALDASIESAMVNAGGLVPAGDDDVDDGEEDTSEEEADSDDDDADDSDDDGNAPTTVTDPEDSTAGSQSGNDGEDDEDEDDDDDDDDFVEPNTGGVKLRLREILFYDDKVAVFKARHGRL